MADLGGNKLAHDALEVLANVAGRNPAIEAVEDRQGAFADDGWIVEAHIQPADCGVVKIRRYQGGRPVVVEDQDMRFNSGWASVDLGLNGHGDHVVAYENPNYADRDREPHDRTEASTYTGFPFSATEIIDLTDGGRLLDQRVPLWSRSSTHIRLYYFDPILANPRSEQAIARITSDPGELALILGQLGSAMGMNQTDVATMVSVVSAKVAA